MQSARALENGDSLIFISADKGFWDDSKIPALHPDLQADLDSDEEIRSSRFRLVKDIYQARIRLQELRNEIDARQAEVASAMLELVTSLMRHGAGWDYDYHHGGHIEGNFPLVEVPRELEDAHIIAVDPEGEVATTEHNGSTYKVTQDALLTIEGNMRRDESLLQGASSVEIWGDINDEYVSAVVVPMVTIEATIEYGDEDKVPDVIDYDVYMRS